MKEGTGSCLREKTRLRLAPLGMVLAIITILASWPIIRFYQGYWPKLTALPHLVVSHERQAGGRWTSARNVSPWLTRALIATEDRTFESNFGVSFEGSVRALLVNLKTGQFTQGGSTLTQQLARDVLLSDAKLFRRKVSEALLAVMITALYSKSQVLSLYLNQVYWGAGSVGIYAASEEYFGVKPSQLTLPEASLIAGLPQAPSAYDPLLYFRRAKVRQWEVLQSMVADGALSAGAARRAYRAPLSLRQPSPGA